MPQVGIMQLERKYINYVSVVGFHALDWIRAMNFWA